jgi:hypothetical protein
MRSREENASKQKAKFHLDRKTSFISTERKEKPKGRPKAAL